MTALVDLVALIGYSGGRVERHLDHGLAGAVLAELARAGRVGVVDGNVVVRSSAPTGQPVSDFALRRIGEDRKVRGPRAWVVRLGGDVRPIVLDRLVGSGLLRLAAGRILGIVPVLVETSDVDLACRRLRQL